jgi:hypothetical protein
MQTVLLKKMYLFIFTKEKRVQVHFLLCLAHGNCRILSANFRKVRKTGKQNKQYMINDIMIVKYEASILTTATSRKFVERV